MTPLTDTADQAGIIIPAPQAPLTNPRLSIPRMLADPRVRLAAGTAALLVTAMTVHRDRVGPREAATFSAVNGLPGWLYPPAWVVMQMGTLGAAPAAAGAATLAAALGFAIDAAIALVNRRIARPARRGKQRASLSQQSPSDPSPAQRVPTPACSWPSP